MKPVRFSPHALEKLTIMQGLGFAIDEETVIAAIKRPQAVLLGHSERSIAQTVLDEDHVLRVVYEEGEEFTIVTLYPGRRRRYES